MHLSKNLTESTQARQFANLQRYQNRQPSIYNIYFGINLITAVDRLPALSKPTTETTEVNLQQNKTQAKGLGQHFQNSIKSKVPAYHHEIDRLNQDVQINQYAISNVLLGRGAHSTVRLSKSNEGFFAIKIMWLQKIRKKYFIKQKQLIEMINAEISLLMELKHPNIVQFKEAIYSSQKERMFIVLEYCSKGSLITVMNSKLTLDDQMWQHEVRGYFRQIVDAISFIHQNNIVHRDIKPQNMLLNQQGKIKIIDFNISHDLKEGNEKLRITNKFIGTKGYAAPELLIGTQKEKIIEGKALDIWALGITLLQLLQRRHPFSVKTIQQLHKYLSKEVQINEQYPAQLKKLLRGMLKLQNEERIKIQEISRNPWVKGK